MVLATPLRKVASKLMAKFGGEVTIRTITTGAYNTTTGAIAETTSDNEIRGVLEDVNAREVNELVQAGDKKLIVAAVRFTPANFCAHIRSASSTGCCLAIQAQIPCNLRRYVVLSIAAYHVATGY